MKARYLITTLVLAALLPAGGARADTIERPTTVRNGPGAWYPALQRLAAGEAVTVAVQEGSWSEVRTAVTNGWVPSRALEAPQRGIDYAGLLNADDTATVSAVDIAAATKGAFTASYAKKHAVDFSLAEALDSLMVAPAMVQFLRGDLAPAPRGRALRHLPRRTFDNTIVLGRDAETVLGHAMVAHVATGGFADNPEMLSYANAVAMVVGLQTERYDIPYRVGILDDDSINGFGLPGGYILLSRGYLRELRNEAELACVIAHEIAHISLYHGLREFKKRETHRRSDAMFAQLDSLSAEADSEVTGVEAGLSDLADAAYLKIIGGRAREDELEADVYGAAYAAAAGYNPMAMVEMLRRVGGLAQQDMFRHHPPLDERLATLEKVIKRYRLQRTGQKFLDGRYREMLKSAAAVGKGTGG